MRFLLPGEPIEFDPNEADEEGLVAVGGELDPMTLVAAYRSGVFPWFDETTPVLWWSPDPRTIIELDGLHISRRLARTIRSSRFTVTADRDFAGVIQSCAELHTDGTWITPEMVDAYVLLHKLGLAHSIEVWQSERLVGGLYGVAIRGLFAGESMFHRVTDASKVALAGAVERLNRGGFQLFDIQLITDHTRRMGAIEIPRSEYLRRLAEAMKVEASFLKCGVEALRNPQ